MKQFTIHIIRIQKSYPRFILPALLSLFTLLGYSYHQEGSLALFFGSIIHFAAFLLLFCILLFFLKFCLGLCFLGLDALKNASLRKANQGTASISYGFLQNNTLLKSMCILLLAWAPYILAAFPGALCIDSQTQLNQVFGYSPYSLHHPMLHTLLMGSCVKFGSSVLGSANIGLFLYIFLQALFLSFALAFTIWAMCFKKVHRTWAYCVLVFYCVTPLFGYYASLAIKDTPFISAFVLFFTCFVLLWEGAPLKGLPLLFFLSSVLVCQFRNNGIYLIGFMLLLFILLFTKHRLWHKYVKTLFAPLVLAIAVHLLINTTIAFFFHPLEGYSREMLSIFMQQTARYVSTYGYDITAEELTVLEDIFGDVDAVVANYNPHLSDPVKNMFKADASVSEIWNYLKVWFMQFWRHPDAYFEAFFHGAYGWFYPFADNASKYFDPGFIFTKPHFASVIDKGVSRWYDTFRKLPILSLLQNIGLYTWLMFLSVSYVWKKGHREKVLYFAPLLFSLLICLAAPAFFMHARYGFPLLFCMPLLIGVITAPDSHNITANKKD